MSLQQSIESSWQWMQPAFNTVFTVRAEKNGANYSLFANARLTFNHSDLSIDTLYRDKQVATHTQYQRQFNDNYGVTTLNVESETLERDYYFSSDIHRNGTRGNVGLRVALNNQVASSSFHYGSILAANTSGIALGRSNYSGVAMLVKVPRLAGTAYSFNVEGSPVANGGTYAVPISRYQDHAFVRTQSEGSLHDIAVQLPANIVQAHPGQVFSVAANVKLSLLYYGFFVDANRQPIEGIVQETGDIVYPNGMFSINSDLVLKYLTIKHKSAFYLCDMSQQSGHYYFCQPDTFTEKQKEK
ncbi:hypothetical protein [Candidatus Fukatsuia endosymbiont of Tuberolachnus salignus]|uniref:hypothetical protein n=1 Tax=Candidatus Fukatsuia endosymbiont of Tuberolachnus salignus TaxID=3077957 RepID=UPI00313D1CEE